MRKRVLPMLLLAIGCLLAASGGALLWLHRARLDEARAINSTRTRELIDARIGAETRAMSAALEAIVRDDAIRKSLASADADALYQQAGPLFDRLHKTLGADSMSFISPERVCLLRVQDRARKGDVIDRQSLTRAQKTGEPATGIESGTSAGCAVRVVYPVLNGEKVLGFVELASDLSTTIAAIPRPSDGDFIVFINKKQLNQPAWQQRNSTSAHPWTWNAFASAVPVAATMQTLPTELAKRASAGLHNGDRFDVALPAQHVGIAEVIPLQDTLAHPLGQIVAIADVTVAARQEHTALWLTLSAVVAVGAGLTAFFCEVVGRSQTELEAKEIELAQAKEEASKAVVQLAQTTHRFDQTNAQAVQARKQADHAIQEAAQAAAQAAQATAYARQTDTELASTKDSLEKRAGAQIAEIEKRSAQDQEAMARLQARLSASEHLMRALVDSTEARIAVVEPSGRIVAVNRGWRDFAREQDAADSTEGANYLSVCDAAAIMDGDEDARAVAAGLRAVLAGQTVQFTHDYPCNGPDSAAWFRLHAVRMPGEGAVRVVVAHEDVTSDHPATPEPVAATA